MKRVGQLFSKESQTTLSEKRGTTLSEESGTTLSEESQITLSEERGATGRLGTAMISAGRLFH